MRRILFMFLVLCVVPNTVRAGGKHVPEHQHKTAWATLKKPVTVSFASSDIRFAQDQVPQVPWQNQWNATAWKGEKVHTQLLLWSPGRRVSSRNRAGDF